MNLGCFKASLFFWYFYITIWNLDFLFDYLSLDTGTKEVKVDWLFSYMQ